MSGKKETKGKPVMALFPPEMETAVSIVLTEAMRKGKYEAENWREGILYSNYVSAMMRHLNQFRRGQRYDKESGLQHLWHAAANLAFLISYEEDQEKYKEYNDLRAYQEKGKNSKGATFRVQKIREKVAKDFSNTTYVEDSSKR